MNMSAFIMSLYVAIKTTVNSIIINALHYNNDCINRKTSSFCRVGTSIFNNEFRSHGESWEILIQ